MLLCISYFLAPLPCTSPYLPATLTLLATKRAPHSRVRHACLGNIVCMCTVRVAHSFYEHMHLQHSIAHRLYNFVGFCGFMVCGNAFAMLVWQRQIAIEQITSTSSASKQCETRRCNDTTSPPHSANNFPKCYELEGVYNSNFKQTKICKR